MFYNFLRLAAICELFTISFSFNLTILHTNDVHARFLSYNAQTKPCTPSDIDEGSCWGGAAHRATTIRQIRESHENVVLLDAGDQFQGTVWYTSLKWEPIAAVMNAMNYTAMTLGNHEFDDGLAGLVPFMKNLTFPLVISNIDATDTLLADTFEEYLLLNISNERVAIVGYTSSETPLLSRSENVKFFDEIESLKKTVQALLSTGINKIIALGHAGIWIDRKVCQQVEGIDIVVGGHTNTFLYTGEPPSTEEVDGPYPEVYKNGDRTCLVVQDYAFGKYLGFLKVSFDEDGRVTSWNGNPILINGSYEEDEHLLKVLYKYQSKYDKLEKRNIGRTAVALDGRSHHCRLKECNLGNVVADSMFDFYLKQKCKLNRGNSSHWSTANLALINGGGVREFYTSASTSVTLEDLYLILPFANTIEMVEIKGRHLLEAFEHSVANYSDQIQHGKFLQMSGARVVYDLNRPNGERVQSLHILCNHCEMPVFEEIDLDKVYSLIVGKFLLKGGDGYLMIKNNVIRSDESGLSDIDIFVEYLKIQPLSTGIDGRISFVGDKSYKSMCRS